MVILCGIIIVVLINLCLVRRIWSKRKNRRRDTDQALGQAFDQALNDPEHDVQAHDAASMPSPILIGSMASIDLNNCVNAGAVDRNQIKTVRHPKILIRRSSELNRLIRGSSEPNRLTSSAESESVSIFDETGHSSTLARRLSQLENRIAVHRSGGPLTSVPVNYLDVTNTVALSRNLEEDNSARMLDRRSSRLTNSVESGAANQNNSTLGEDDQVTVRYSNILIRRSSVLNRLTCSAESDSVSSLDETGHLSTLVRRMSQLANRVAVYQNRQSLRSASAPLDVTNKI